MSYLTSARALSNKKLATGVVSMLILSVSFVPTPTHAQIPVTDVGNLTVNTVNSVNTVAQATGVNVRTILDGLAWSLAKMTVQSLTRSTVNWINSGFQGSPAFVSDLRQNLQALGDAVADDFFDQLNQLAVDTTGFNIRSPFQDQLNQKLRNEYYRTTSSWGLDYTLSQTSRDPQAFLNGNFREGGFNAFFSASQNPSNNPFDAYRQASAQLFAQVDGAAQRRISELNWGNGFLPWRGSCNNHGNGNTGGATSLSNNERCLFNNVRTPGSVIESQLEHALGTGLRQLELADSINEIVAALMGQLVNQVLGAGGLIGASEPSSGGGSSFISQATSQSQYDGLNTSLAGGVAQNIINDKLHAEEYRDAWQKILDAASDAKERCGDTEEITTIFTRATTAVARGNTAISKLQEIETGVTDAALSTAVDKGTQITTAVTDYQTFLGSSEIPNLIELEEAISESTDSSGSDESSSDTKSLYTKMIEARNSCSVGSGT